MGLPEVEIIHSSGKPPCGSDLVACNNETVAVEDGRICDADVVGENRPYRTLSELGTILKATIRSIFLSVSRQSRPARWSHSASSGTKATVDLTSRVAAVQASAEASRPGCGQHARAYRMVRLFLGFAQCSQGFFRICTVFPAHRT